MENLSKCNDKCISAISYYSSTNLSTNRQITMGQYELSSTNLPKTRLGNIKINKTEELGSNLHKSSGLCNIIFFSSGFLPDRLSIVVLTKAESEDDKPDEQSTSLEDSNRNKDVKRPNLTGSPHLSNLSSFLDNRWDSTEFDWFWLDLTAFSPRYVPYVEPRSLMMTPSPRPLWNLSWIG